jgi:signal transduction histidine kinase
VGDSERLRGEDQLSVLKDITSLSAEVLSIDEACEAILIKLAQAFPCVGCWLATTRRPDGALQLRATSGFSWAGDADLSPVSPERLVAIRSDAPGVWLFAREKLPPDLPFVDNRVGDVAVATLSAYGSCVGVATLMLPTGQSFTSQQAQLLSALSSQAGLVVHTANLVTAAQELVVQEERSRIAREIHDGVSQNLALLILKMEIISRLTDREPQRVKGELVKAQSIIEICVQELRRSIYTLRSPDLAGLGLIPAIQRLVRDFTEQTNIEVDLALPAALSLPPQAVSAVFSVVQERLDIVSGEASASRVAVEVGTENSCLSILVKDNGQRPLLPPMEEEGLTPSWLGRLRGRVRPLGGTVTMKTGPSETVVETQIPLRQ